jgi:hypothetical protein
MKALCLVSLSFYLLVRFVRLMVITLVLALISPGVRACRILEKVCHLLGHLQQADPNSHGMSEYVHVDRKMGKSAFNGPTQMDCGGQTDAFPAHMWT